MVRDWGSRWDRVLVSVAAVVVVGWYLLTYRYPAHRGGLYLVMARQVATNWFLPPATITGYTPAPLPFAYPPLGIYAMAVPIAFGVPDLLVLHLLPAVTFVGSAVAVGAFVYDRFSDSLSAALAAVFVLTSPQVLYQGIVGAGVTRSLGLTFAMLGLVAVRQAVQSKSRHTILAGVAFGLCLLTHYVFTLLFVVGTLLTVAVERRSPQGTLQGVKIAGIGAVLASPWYLIVVARHGLDTVLAPGGSYQNGLAPVPWSFLFRLLVQTISPVGYLAVAGALVGTAVLIRRRRPFLPVFALGFGTIYPHPPALYALLATLSAVGVAAIVSSLDGPRSVNHVGARVVLTLVVCTSMLSGVAYLDPGTDAAGSPPVLLDEDSAAAMDWLDRETPQNATVLAGGRVGEWVPAIAHRPIVASQWGTEWVGPERRDQHRQAYWRGYFCRLPKCYAALVAESTVEPDYLLTRVNATERTAFHESEHFDVVFQQGDVLVVSVDHREWLQQARSSGRVLSVSRSHPVTSTGFRPESSLMP